MAFHPNTEGRLISVSRCGVGWPGKSLRVGDAALKARRSKPLFRPGLLSRGSGGLVTVEVGVRSQSAGFGLRSKAVD